MAADTDTCMKAVCFLVWSILLHLILAYTYTKSPIYLNLIVHGFVGAR